MGLIRHKCKDKFYFYPSKKDSLSSYEYEAYCSFYNQKTRCYNKKSSQYKNYGLKGLTVDYTIDEFKLWWIEQRKNFNGQTPTCGRIDHAKGYNFQNITMEDKSLNSIERQKRVGPPTGKIRSIFIISSKNGADAKVCRSMYEASKLTGERRETIKRRLICPWNPSPKGWHFIECEEVSNFLRKN